MNTPERLRNGHHDHALPTALTLPAADVAAIRKRLGHFFPLPQDDFARRYGLSAATVRDWEQGRRKPDRAACVLLALIDRDPAGIEAAVKAAAAALDITAAP